MPSWKCLLAEHRGYQDYSDKCMDVLIEISGIHTNKLISLHQSELVGLEGCNVVLLRWVKLAEFVMW